LNAYTASESSVVNRVLQTTASLNTYTGSNDSLVARVLQTTASLNTYTGSNDSVVNKVLQTTASLNTYTGSNDSVISRILQTTASLNSYTGSESAVVNQILQTTASLNSKTGSYITTGSAGLTQSITGSLAITGSITITSGSITMPHRPAFRIIGDGGSISSPTRISGSRAVVDYNQGNYWNNTNGTFTAPIAGLYQVNVVGRTNSNSLDTISQIIVTKLKASDSSTATQIMVEWGPNTSANHIGGSTISKLDVGDVLYAWVGAGTISFDGNDNFSVAYIG
jgi:hypothetical protein